MEALQQVRAVIFDMDGLMFDTEPIYRMAWQQAVAEQGFTLSDELYNSYVGRSNAEGEALLASLFDTRFSLPLFRQRWATLWYEYVAAHGVPHKPGLGALLELLEKADTPRAVATSASRREAELCLRPLADRFQAVVTADEVQRGKPAPDLFLLAAERLGMQPSSCLVLEDSHAGVRAAEAAGMPAILVPDLQQPSPEILQVALRLCSSLFEVRALLATALNGTSPA